MREFVPPSITIYPRKILKKSFEEVNFKYHGSTFWVISTFLINRDTLKTVEPNHV